MDNQTITKMFYVLAGLDGLAMILITVLAAIHDGSAIPAALQYLQDQPTILPTIAGALGVSHVIGTAIVQRAVANTPTITQTSLPLVPTLPAEPLPSVSAASSATNDGPSA